MIQLLNLDVQSLYQFYKLFTMQESIDYFAYRFVNSANYQHSILESIQIALKKSIELYSVSLVQNQHLQAEKDPNKPVLKENSLHSQQFPQNYQQIRPQNTIHGISVKQQQKNIIEPSLEQNTKNIAIKNERLTFPRVQAMSQKIDILICLNPKISKKIKRCELRIPWKMLRNPCPYKKIQKIKRIRFKNSLIPTADISNSIPIQEILMKRNDILSRRLSDYETLLSSKKKSRELAYLFS